MEVITSIRPVLAIIVSLIAACLILITGERSRNLRELWTILASVAKFIIVASMIPFVLQGKVIEYTVISLAPGLLLQFRVDAFGLLFGILASTLWIATSLYSIGYMRGLNEHAQTRYFFCFAIALSATMGIAFAANLLTLFIFYEILTMATYPLVAHKETPDAIKGGRKYLAYTLTAGVVILLASAIIYSLTGTLDFKPGGYLAGHASADMLRFLFVALIMGFGVKAAIMPLHEWLPTAMVAPAPVSALLHAVAVVKAGVFGVLRVILYVFGPNLLHDMGLWLILAYFVSFSVIVSCFFALAQDNLKRRLAFSTINNLAIIILGAALLSTSAIKGGMLHMAYHGFMKITLFFVAGAIYVKTHKEDVSELDGLGRQMPLTLGSFAIGAMGVAGIPPVCGFISKWYLCLGSLEAKEIVFLFVFLTSALLDAAFFFPIVYSSFFKKPKGDVNPHFDEASMFMVIPLMATAIASLILGIFPNAFVHFFEIATLAVRSVLGS
ncbi:MAG: cation:proton antiporter [Deltaproteobacteria bacterium CG12_big_fil_rev_8_21_14_0_65_43_10]|nr:MAG: cation:proton antiporter [Deltaproteobacteria bacterium CG2_30_43_15]PIQ46451.1 MAG: cation:proton antiporter [Deltaproteobacteria bacterium CG12_big_fil_rev_8_21_14_0_65_43_10]PIU86049.1 MAG: cation:proton antiporter [Deltaproteobacteria bacterium CG06_land_8_20_14_3_00_44_19]PIX23086.1 MAG: cation:proton antiporter [Deltaproteobacteria bacterium CG_4_8_14_3_um_filter_43_13]PIZ18754.1 MAG: cation:proton antiporter [Deltaproteobacteria bacterium CG_4_10_14_0_8_um_filter_43_12]PJB39594.